MVKPTPKKTTKANAIATSPPTQIVNTDKRQMDMANPNRKGGGNTPLKVATCGGVPEATHYDDIKESLGAKVSYPADFQTVIRDNEQQQNIPAWNSMSTSIDAPDAITRTNEPIYHQGFRKEHNKTVMDHGDNTTIRHSHKQDGGTIIHNENSQVDKAFSPTSETLYGGKLPKRSSSSPAIS